MKRRKRGVKDNKKNLDLDMNQEGKKGGKKGEKKEKRKGKFGGISKER